MDGLEIVNGGQMRPAGFGELLARIWKLLREDVWAYIKLAALPVGVLTVLEGGFFWVLHAVGLFPTQPGVQPSPQAQQGAWASFLGILIIMPLVMAAYSIYEGAACATALAATSGMRLPMREAYGMAVSRAWRLLWMMFLRMAAVMLPFVVAMVVFAIGIWAMAVKGATPHPALYFVLVPLVVALYLGGFVWAFWISLHLLLATPVCMAEDLSAWNSLKRSGQLSRGGKWRMFGVFFVVGLIMTAVVMALEMIVFALLGLGALTALAIHAHPVVPHSTGWIVSVSILGAVVFYLLIALQWASYSVTMTVLYQDQRFRAEGVAPLAGEPA